MKRGDIVMVDFPYSDGLQSKFRPAVIVQSDQYNATWRKTIVVMVTGNISRRNDPAHLFIDPATEPGIGLKGPSVVSCLNFFTLDRKAIHRTLGCLSDTQSTRLDVCLIEALGIAHA